MNLGKENKQPIEHVLNSIEELLINSGYGRLHSIKFEINNGHNMQTISFDQLVS